MRLTWIWVFCVPLCAQDQDRDFTGTWRLSAAHSQIGRLRVQPASILRIRHNGPSIECAVPPGEDPVELGCSYKTDGSETRVKTNVSSISSMAKWEGRALLTNSIIRGTNNCTRMDRWTLSGDRNTLRIRRQILSSNGEVEAVLIYERESPHEAARTQSEPSIATASERFGRPVLVPTGPERYRHAGLNEIQAPMLAGSTAAVSCLAYRDASRMYVEVLIRNRSGRTITIPEDFISAEQGGRPLRRTDTTAVAEAIGREAVRPFKPSPSGRDSKTGEFTYAPSFVDEQVRRRLDQQERETTFTSLLLAMAQSGTVRLNAGHEHTIAATFEAGPDIEAPVSIAFRFGEELLRFSLKCAQ